MEGKFLIGYVQQCCLFLYVPSLYFFKARNLSGSAFCNFHRLGVPEQALGGIPLGFGIVVKDKASAVELTPHYTLIWTIHVSTGPKNDMRKRTKLPLK